jgi:hypothetical protein
VSAIESPLLIFFSPQKAKNDDKVTFLERISEKYLVTFGNFCNFAAHLTKCPNDPINDQMVND